MPMNPDNPMPRGICPVCNKSVALIKGKLRRHGVFLNEHCPGEIPKAADS